MASISESVSVATEDKVAVLSPISLGSPQSKVDELLDPVLRDMGSVALNAVAKARVARQVAKGNNFMACLDRCDLIMCYKEQ